MTRFEAWLHHLANVLVGGTGVVYGWMLYLAEPVDEFALVNHPAQPLFHDLHLWTAPLLAFVVGTIWKRHVWARVRSGFHTRRRTGLLLTGVFLPMVSSGYFLQTAVDEGWRVVWLWVHLSTSALWVLAYAVHQLSRRSQRAEAAVRAGAQPSRARG